MQKRGRKNAFVVVSMAFIELQFAKRGKDMKMRELIVVKPMFFVLSICLSVLSLHADEAWWTNVVTGAEGASWGDAGNWVNGSGDNVVPDAGHANLTAVGGSYTVNYDSVQPGVTNLNIENSQPYTTDLVMSAPFTTLGGGEIRIKEGASVTVTNGGVWNYEGINSVSTSDESFMSIRNGGELNLAGGLIAFTNLVNETSSDRHYINVGYESTGTLNVTSGRLDFYETFPRSHTNTYRTLRVGRSQGGHGTMNISGGSVTLGTYQGGGVNLIVGSGGGSPIGSTYGELTVSDAELVFTNNTGSGWNQMQVGTYYGIGQFTVTNNAYVNLRAGGVSARVYCGMTPYGHGTFRMNGGYMRVGDGVTIGTSSGYSSGVSSTGIIEVTDGKLDCGSGFHIGTANSGPSQCFGFGNISGGQLIETYWGVFVGRSRNGGRATGRLTMTNGLLHISNSAGVNDSDRAHSGLGIGVIYHNDANADSWALGEMTVSGTAAVTNRGVLVIGVNGATGTVVQAGGHIQHYPGASDRYTIIGYGSGTSTYHGGGNGSYYMSGGSYYTPNRVFVGGVPADIQSFSREGCVGHLKVSGGSFTVDDILMVGGNGEGTLTIGEAGSCSVENLVLTNTTQSTLRFELGTDGLGSLSASDTLEISAGTKLEVDTTAYEGGSAWIKLVDCATRSTSFALEDISVVGQGVIRQDVDEDIWLNMQRGTIIIVH